VCSGNNISLCLEPKVSSHGTHKLFVLKYISFFTTALFKMHVPKEVYACASWIRNGSYCLPNTRIKLRVRKGGEIVKEFLNFSTISKKYELVPWRCSFSFIPSFSTGIAGYITSLQD
jgi:hypothetical protein